MEDTTDDLIDTVINREPTENELDTFKNLVNDWFKYDDQIRKLVIAIKERKNYQRVLNSKIENFMTTYKYNDLNTQFGRIQLNERNIKTPINIGNIKESIIKNSSLSGEELLNKIFNEERQIITKKNIRRIIPTVSLTI